MGDGDRPGETELMSMGCRWRLDLSGLDATAAAEMVRRWCRGIDLLESDTPLLDAEPVVIRPVVGARPGDRGGGVLEVHVPEVDRLPYALSRELTRTGLTRLRGRALLLHAAALADAQGRAVVLVAPSGGGKSTAAKVLGQELGYVTDEAVVLLADGRIAPHPKPPSLVDATAERGHKVEPSPDEIGLGPTPPSPHLAGFLTLLRDPEVRRPRLEVVGLLDQVLAVLAQTSSSWLVEDSLDRLARAVTVAGAPVRLHYAEIEGCHELVREHLATATPAAPSWVHLAPEGRDRYEEPGAGPPEELEITGQTRVARGPWSDAIATEGEVLVLLGSRPLRLAGAGAVLWQAAGAPATVAELTTAVITALGSHPEAEEIIRKGVAELVRHGLLHVLTGADDRPRRH